MVQRLIAALGLLLFLQSCAKDSSVSKTLPVFQLKSCIDENVLMSTGIIGGSRVYQNSLDANKVMLLFSGRQDDAELCTATAIAPNVLLTAAHCIVSTPANSQVVLYSSISCESGFNPKSNMMAIKEFIVHPQYKMDKKDPEYLRNDVALVVLENTLPSHYKIHKIADPRLIDDQSAVQFLGYGVTKLAQKGNHGTGMLRKIELSMNDITIDESRGKVEVNQSRGKGICSGDSGGPAFVEVNGRQQILGVNSYVEGLSDPSCSYKSHLVLAYPYINWIQNELSLRNLSGLK